MTFAPRATSRSASADHFISIFFDPRTRFSKKNRGDFSHWTESDGKEAAKQGENFRNHPVRNFFKTVKPSIMPGLNDTMSK